MKHPFLRHTIILLLGQASSHVNPTQLKSQLVLIKLLLSNKLSLSKIQQDILLRCQHLKLTIPHTLNQYITRHCSISQKQYNLTHPIQPIQNNQSTMRYLHQQTFNPRPTLATLTVTNDTTKAPARKTKMPTMKLYSSTLKTDAGRSIKPENCRSNHSITTSHSHSQMKHHKIKLYTATGDKFKSIKPTNHLILNNATSYKYQQTRK